jgi:hypothetical protein
MHFSALINKYWSFARSLWRPFKRSYSVRLWKHKNPLNVEEIGNFTINRDVVIKDVYLYLSQIYKLIRKFRNNYKMVAFDAIQQEEKDLLNKSIILCKLNRHDNCKELFPEMMNYVNLFSSLNNWNVLANQTKKFVVFCLYKIKTTV